MTQMCNNSLLTAAVVWKLEDLYTSPEDPHIGEHVRQCRERATALMRRYAGRVADLDAAALAGLIADLEALNTLVTRLSTYAFLNFITRIDDAAASALHQQMEELAAEIGRLTVFFRLEWNHLPGDKARQLVATTALQRYAHYLEALRRYAPYQLGQQREELLQELAPVGRSAWNVLFDKVMGQLRFGEEQRSEEEVLSDLYHRERSVRIEAAQQLTQGLRNNLHILTHIFNTLAAEKMIEDRVRGYPHWSAVMNLENELADTTVETLVEVVTSRYDLVHRYYRLKRRLLGLDELFDYDRYAPVPGLESTALSWPACREIVQDAFTRFSPEMARISAMFFDNGWIHAPVLPAKRGGAFAHPCVPDVHPYVMVNYTGNLRDVATVAHELGHGVHQYLAAPQGLYNADTPLVLAETASVFAELLVFRAQLELLDSDAQRRAFTCQKLESIFATVFRQVAMNRFEARLHNGRREEGELSGARLSSFWLETQQPMFGDAVTLTEGYGLWWSYIPHFLATPGYVYSYAFGELLVLALYARYLDEGDDFVARYLDLLAAGGSKAPGDLLLPFAINLNDPEFWQGGLTIIEGMLEDVGA
ncbi:MAG: oligoendopeptidase F [Desulfobulbus propionicus]|nr:MAG: oligoendopeptidase F [Desulfobulbus propionicus]